VNDSLSPDVAVSDYLRDQSRWPGSSSSVFYDDNGNMVGAFVTVFVPNRHRFRALLTWLGVPSPMINQATGFED
jgi:hypothetical protein